MEFLLLGSCFFFVLLAVLGGGYWFLREPSQVASESISVVRPEASEGTVRQTLEKIGSFVPAANVTDHPVRRQLASAGYRSPDAMSMFFGIKAVTAILDRKSVV